MAQAAIRKPLVSFGLWKPVVFEELLGSCIASMYGRTMSVLPNLVHASWPY
eukprot:CAMPEP_0168444494 /NCGR_PEP_ID=MMETSP0228-20121227/45076_1 /TAXON_ID=133427 /ORGANISM="Protoceratium reticulatum, Strain CCCM 535 (=CCMP 1889)" /LENGTH=50 /DNA_ID=CAMNT_0008458935 /DNA_START=21 /DNA_END=170 /DNA_ORIENTATION=-